MWSGIFRNPFFSRTFFYARHQNIFTLRTARSFALPLFTFGVYRYKCNTISTNQQRIKTQQQMNKILKTKIAQDPAIKRSKMSFLQKTFYYIAHVIRFFHLLLIFIPPLVLLPLRMFDCTRNYWMDSLVTAIQRAGVVWIKALQYMSHRRDMIGVQMAEKFSHLRQNAPEHSFEETKRNFKKNYGKQINQIFEQFDETPLASASVSQVYKAVYQGKKVAVKVRHPGVDKYIQRDVNVLFFFSKVLSLFSRSFQIPVGEQSLMKTLIDQIDFNNEADNLQIFNKMFLGRKDVKFPVAFNSTDSVLIQSFIDGVPISYYQTNRHPLNQVMARIGAKTFFEMLMKNNFIHADCHSGNIFVTVKDKSSQAVSQLWFKIKQWYYYMEQILIESTFESDTLRKLFAESRKEEARIRKLIQQAKQKVEVTLIDVGMVIRLQEQDKANFVNFIKSVVQRNSNKCAELIYSLSNFDGKKILPEAFSDYLSDLKKLFQPISELQKVDDFQNGAQIFTEMLDVIRNHNMKLEGQFATLLTNMLVLEAIAKDIDPKIQILKVAVPYFAYIDKQKVL